MYKNVLLKLSGEALAGDDKKGINNEVLTNVAKVIKDIVNKGVKLSIIVGGGNFWRGRTSENMNRVNADYIGMLATIMNGMALSEALKSVGVKARVLSGLDINKVCEPYTYRDAIKYLNEGRVLIFVGGTGHPFFSTDTAAALRGAEMGCEAILCGKTTDAVYDSDPKTNPNAKKYTQITFDEVLNKNLKVMDGASIAIARDNNIKILVFGMDDLNNIKRVINGENVGTIIE